MSNDIYRTSWGGDIRIGLKPGIRVKYFGHEWEPAQFENQTPPPEVFDAIQKVNEGIPLDRSELPELASVWNESAFAKKGDLFGIGGFYAVRGKMAEVLQKFDLGEGGLIPVPLLKSDLKTPWPEPVWWLNFGATKGCFVPEESKGLRFLVDHRDGYKIWSFNGSTEDDMIAVSPRALEGTALWVERALLRQIFISGNLVRALAEAKVKPKLRLSRVHIVGDDR